LILTIKNSLDSITIKDVFKDESNSQGIKGIEFNDGSSMNLEDIKKGVLISSDSDQKTFYGFNSDDTIIGGDGNEYLYGKGGNDTLIGNKGDDIISGGDGNDILIGGEGNDELQGGSGNDTYVFGRGDGNDKIINYDSDSGQNDIIKFEEDITKDDLIFKRVRTSDGVGDLVVSIKGTKDSICVSGMFNVVDNNHILNEQYKINKIEFSDGSYMDLEAIQLALKNNNVIIHSSYFWRNNEGSDEDDEIYGDDDSNYLAGNKGDDILIGGKGADRLNGGEGADTYVFAKGDGNDTISADGNDIIKFKEGISKDDLLITREYSNLKINFKNSDDSITVSGMFYEADGNSQGIKAIEFSDGSSLSLEDIRKTVLANNDSVDIHDIIYGFNTDDVIMGSSQMNFIRARGGNDTVYGKEGNDTISGDAGNDLLIGGEGDDTYEYNMGDGNDTIDNTGGGNDTILFSYGISKDDVSFKKDGNDLIVTVNKDSSQTINVKNHFLGGDYAIDQIKFASNGSVLSRKDILKLMNTVHLTSEGGNNNLVDKGQKDNVYTYAGGRVTISDNGGYDKVIFKNKTYSVNYSKKGDNLLISANKITASNNNVLEVKDFFKGANHIIEDFDLSEYSLVTARRIYEDFGITYPVAQSKQEVLTGGKEDNVYIYTGGRKIIDDKGGNDRVVFQGLEEGLFYRQKGNNLLISTKKMTTDNEDILEVKNFFSSKNSIIEEFQITDYWSVSARKIYEDFDETYPASTSTQNAPLALLGTTNKNNEASLNDSASDM
jgi:calcium binding hemolysin protein, putative